MSYEFKYLDIKDLIPYAKNSRTHSDEQVNQVVASIHEWGFTNPVLIDENGFIIAGHCRLLAAKKVGLAEIPCIVLDGLTEAQKKAYIIADNKLALNAGWDDELLALEISDLKELEFDIELLGFTDDELDAVFGPEVSDGLTDDDAVPDPPENPVTVEDDIWILGDHRLFCGDATLAESVNEVMGGEAPDLVFADPPYGIDVVQNSKIGGDADTSFGTIGGGKMVEVHRYSKVIGDETTETAKAFYQTCVELGYKNIVLWGGNYFTDFLAPSRCWIIWDKEMTGYFSQAEMAWTSFSKGGVKVFKHLWNGLSREGNRKDELKARIHPTQKPVGLFVEIFNRFDGFKVIFDGFGGSGSTMIACEKTGRLARLMELDPKYCDVIINRWQDFTGRDAIHAANELTFTEIENGEARPTTAAQ